MLSKERKGEAIISVAEAEGKVVGMCDIIKYSPCVEQSHVGTVGILIREGFWSKGIGTALMKDVIKRARPRYSLLSLHVFGNNGHALHVYQKLGFRVYVTLHSGIVRSGNKIDDVLMCLKL